MYTYYKLLLEHPIMIVAEEAALRKRSRHVADWSDDVAVVATERT